MDLPVCLIKNTADGKMQVNAEAIDILSKVTEPVVVVAIVGLYRTGKSYLMNKLAGSQKGFALGSTVQAQTKGIWMRYLPHPTMAGHTLVVLDTEGLGDVEKGDKKNDMWIFCLATLLSSALVYNSKAIIDEDAIEKIHYVGEMADLIKVKSKDNDDDEAEFDRHFPIFIWAVRDVTLKLEFNGKPITEDEYLENALMLQKAENGQKRSSKVERHNRCRECIRMYFKERKCFMFDPPSVDKNVLHNMDEVSDDQLNSVFTSQTKKFCDYVYKNAGVKYMDDVHKVTGKSLAHLATMYTNAISSSNAACIEDVVTNISVAENTVAVREATQHYENKMKERVTLPTETLDQILKLSEECEKEALKIFMKRSFKDNDCQFQKQFLEIIEQKKNEFFQKNDIESQAHCEKLIKTISKDLQNCLDQGSYVTAGGYQMFNEEMIRIEEKYKNEPRKGTKAEEVLQKFKKSKKVDGITIMKSDKALSDQQKQGEEAKANKEKQKLQRKMEEDKRSEENKKMEHQRRIYEENFKEMAEKIQKEKGLMHKQLQDSLQHKTKERDLYRLQGWDKQAMIYQRQINKVHKQQKELDVSTLLSIGIDLLSLVAVALLPPPYRLAAFTIAQVLKMVIK